MLGNGRIIYDQDLESWTQTCTNIKVGGLMTTKQVIVELNTTMEQYTSDKTIMVTNKVSVNSSINKTKSLLGILIMINAHTEYNNLMITQFTKEHSLMIFLMELVVII